MQSIVKKWINRYLGTEETLFLLILLIVFTLVVVQLGTVLAPFFAALVISFVLQGFVGLLTRWGMSNRVAVFAVFLVFITLLFAAVIIFVPLLIKQSTLLVGEIPNMFTELKLLLISLPEKYPQILSQQQYTELWTTLSNEISGGVQEVLQFSVARVPDLIALLIYLILVPLMVFFMLLDKQLLINTVLSLLPQKRDLLDTIWIEMNQQLANYIRGKALEIAIVGIASYVTFLVLGLNYAALLGLLVGLSVLIPYIGATVVTIPIAMVGYFQWGWSSEFYWLLGCYGVIQFLDGNILVPLLFSEAVNLHPLAIILAVLLFGGIWGFWGVFFAIPLATLIKAVYSAWPRDDQSAAPSLNSITVEDAGSE